MYALVACGFGDAVIGAVGEDLAHARGHFRESHEQGRRSAAGTVLASIERKSAAVGMVSRLLMTDSIASTWVRIIKF